MASDEQHELILEMLAQVSDLKEQSKMIDSCNSYSPSTDENLFDILSSILYEIREINGR